MTVETMRVPRQTPRPIGAEEMVARRVEYERKRRGWSNAELARRMTDFGCPINQSAIQKIEHGSPRRTISLDETLAFMYVFGLSLETLQSPPEEVIGAEVARFIQEMYEAGDQALLLLTRVNELLARFPLKGTDWAANLLDYMRTDAADLRLMDKLSQVLIETGDTLTQLGRLVGNLVITRANGNDDNKGADS
jgi:transcriptional regulator with XRE-family HTH domain